jgi:hypothetical protein
VVGERAGERRAAGERFLPEELPMPTMPFRQVHLDFHTSEQIPGVGSRFDGERFAETLKRAHVNSITCFSRCHHGDC